MRYLTVTQVLQIHEYQVRRFGGMPGVKFPDLLESAVARPAATFGGRDLYPTLAGKAAALAFSLTQNHCFHDGNKRTAHAAMIMFLGRNGQTIEAPLDEQGTIFESLGRDGLLAWGREWQWNRKPA